MTRSRAMLGLAVVAVLLLFLFLVAPRGGRSPATVPAPGDESADVQPARGAPSTPTHHLRNAHDVAAPVEARVAPSPITSRDATLAAFVPPPPPTTTTTRERMSIPLPSATPDAAEAAVLAPPVAPAAPAVGTLADVATSPTPAPDAAFCPTGTTLKVEKVSGTKQKFCEKGDRAGVEIKEGPYVAWWGDGTKHYQGEYKSGRREGEWTEWYGTGVIASRGEYRKGKRDGMWTFWREDGKKAEEGTFKNDEKAGHWIVFDDHGHRAAEGEIRTDDARLCKEHGKWVYYWPNGVKKEEGLYDQGRREGRWTEFDAAGRVVSVAEYHQGEKE